MSVLNIAYATVKDPAKMRAYIEAAAPIMAEHDAEVVIRGHYVKSLLGDDLGTHIVGVFRFPDMGAAEAFYGCEQYLALVKLRDEAATMTFNFYEE